MTLVHYLAGPMSGKPGFNYAAFDQAAAYFRGRNMEIKSPHEVDNGSTDKPYEWYIRNDLKMLLECDAIILLPGWEASRGASLEEEVAHLTNMYIFQVAPGYRLVHARRGNQDATGIH